MKLECKNASPLAQAPQATISIPNAWKLREALTYNSCCAAQLLIHYANL
jgi:hypothetical protein